jgi:hypothetical protein
MALRVVPALLAAFAFTADLGGAHELALVVLFVAIPAAFALAVACYADSADEGSLGGAAVAAAGLFLLVLSAALRSPAVVGGVPRIAITAVALAPLPCLYSAVRVARTAQPVRHAMHFDEREDLRDAA